MNDGWTIKILMFASVGYYIKGIDIAVRAISQFRKESDVDMKLVIAVTKEREQEFIREIRDDCGGSIPPWVIIVHTRQDVASLYHAVDVYLNASRSEGFCYSNIEAIYCGCQVILSDIPQNLVDMPGAIVVEKENVNQLKDKLLDYSCGKSQSSELQRRYVVEKYNIQKWADRCFDVLEEFA